MVRIAPLTKRIPVPRVDRQLRALTVSQRPKTSRKHFFEVLRPKLLVCFALVVAIHTGTEGVRRNESICRTARSDFNDYRCWTRALALCPADGYRLKSNNRASQQAAEDSNESRFPVNSSGLAR